MAYQPSNREAKATFRGRVSTFRTPGRAGTAGQKLFSLFNPAASGKVAILNQIVVDLYQTVVKAVGTAPPLLRVHQLVAAPTNGTVLTRVPKDTALPVASAVCEARGDASADGTGSGTTLTHAVANGAAATTLTQEFAPRLITAAGYEMFDRTELLEGKEITLRAGQGILVFLDYTAAGQNPTTDMWMVGCDWFEYTG
jgi:hypothetical protein